MKSIFYYNKVITVKNALLFNREKPNIVGSVIFVYKTTITIVRGLLSVLVEVTWKGFIYLFVLHHFTFFIML